MGPTHDIPRDSSKHMRRAWCLLHMKGKNAHNDARRWRQSRHATIVKGLDLRAYALGETALSAWLRSSLHKVAILKTLMSVCGPQASPSPGVRAFKQASPGRGEI